MRRRALLLLPLILIAIRCASSAPPSKTAVLVDDGCTPTCCTGTPPWAICNTTNPPDCPPNPQFSGSWPPNCAAAPPGPSPACNPPRIITSCIPTPPGPPKDASCPSRSDGSTCGLSSPASGRLQFVVLGDWGDAVCQPAPQCPSLVSNMVQRWHQETPLDFILTVGDNFYPFARTSDICTNMAMYAWFERPFFPTLGNHDLYTACGQTYYAQFQHLAQYSPNAPPYTPRYYTYSFPGGLIDLFVLNADSTEPDGIGPTCRQAMWLKGALAASSARWKIVTFHEPAYATNRGGVSSPMQWPFHEWGASIVLNGHEHLYERIERPGAKPGTSITYVINGVGGTTGLDQFTGCAPAEGSRARFANFYGAMIGVATSETLELCMMSLDPDKPDGTCVDNFTLR